MADAGPETTIVLPKLGLTMSEGLLAEWHVAPGDEVRAGQLLFVVETDKISSEVEAPGPGRITALLVAEGATVNVGTAVATWTGDGRVAEAIEPVGDALPPPPMVIAPPERSAAAGRQLATPFARRLAALGGVDVAQVTGTGPRRRVQANDVRKAIASRDAAARPVATPRTAGPRDRRALIAARVARSNAEVPQFHVTADVAFDALTALRRDLNADPLAPGKLSVTALLGAAAARALAILPAANVVWRNDRVEPLPGVAIGIAVDTPGGVMAPVVAAGSGVYAFAQALEAAIARARAGRLTAADSGAAAIGISNVGMFGVRSLVPIVDPDQTFMLGVGAPRGIFRPGARGEPLAVSEVTLSLACDHRAIDGAAAARLLAMIVELLEAPARLLIPY